MPHANLIVAEGDDHEDGSRSNPATQIANPVDGRVVDPVRVLDHHDGGGAARERSQDRASDFDWRCRLVEQCADLSLHQLIHVGKEAMRARGSQRLAGANEHAFRGGATDECLHEARLANTRFAAQEEHASMSVARLGEQRVQIVKVGGSL